MTDRRLPPGAGFVICLLIAVVTYAGLGLWWWL